MFFRNLELTNAQGIVLCHGHTVTVDVPGLKRDDFVKTQQESLLLTLLHCSLLYGHSGFIINLQDLYKQESFRTGLARIHLSTYLYEFKID